MTSTQQATRDTLAASARGLTKTYGRGDTEVHALRGVDLDLPRGRFTAIMGPSGSGKSTLMHCLAGLDQASGGTVTVAGTDLAALDDDALTTFRREHVGFVFQSFNLLVLVLLAVVATGLGTVIGVGFGWVGYETFVERALSEVPLQVPWLQLGVVVLLAALAGLLACVLPARRAARVTPAAGLSLD